MAATALRFILAHPEVSTVIPGAKSPAQLAANLAAASAPLDAATVTALRQLWSDEIAPRFAAVVARPPRHLSCAAQHLSTA